MSEQEVTLSWEQLRQAVEPMEYEIAFETEGHDLFLSDFCRSCSEEVAFRRERLCFRATTPCPAAAQIPFTFELNVPSGRLVLGNALLDRFFTPIGDFDQSLLLGRMARTRAYENIGCAHAMVGNRPCGLYRVASEPAPLFLLADLTKEENMSDLFGESLVSMDTSFWWYTIVDADEYVRRGGWLHTASVDFVTVEPGVYRFTHRHYEPKLAHDAYRDGLMTLMEWVRPPDPVRDFAAERMSRHLTAGQLLAHLEREIPMFYTGEAGIHLAVNELLSHEHLWHPNGFPDISLIPMTSPDRTLPVLARRDAWVDFEKSGRDSPLIRIANGTIRANPSFLELVRRALVCIVTHGIELRPRDYPGETQMRAYELELRALAAASLKILEQRLS
ncbi:hypothetical protein KBA73_00525 [Patescibacteria group bacterium]|nr:hypothetical protein [Patescibacteria group bacterium]